MLIPGRRRVLYGSLAATVLSRPAHASAPIQGVASVVDGNTLEIHGKWVILQGIDAPESGQQCQRPDGKRWRCGQRAALALADRIGRSVVRCSSLGRGKDGRLSAICHLGRLDLNYWMVAQGWAVAHPRSSHDYSSAEKSAREARVGIWAGQFEMPWDWRASRGQTTKLR